VEPEKKAVQEAVRDLVGRGWTYGDIAVLAYRNEDVVRVSSWLNEIGVPFIPYSSLDVRKRRIVAEVLALLKFLDSPPDDLSFAAFLGGDLFAARLRRDGGPLDPEGIGRFFFANREADRRPLYTAFRTEHPALWDRYFEPLFRAVGYYPLYDLITLLYRTFDVFALFPLKESFPGGGTPEGCAEEGALVKLLEAVKNFEGEGRNDLREFVELAGDDETGAGAWNIDVPADLNAVRVMSIHKAKGLGFPVVILLLYGQRWQPPPFFVLEDEARVRVVKLNERLSNADEQLADAYKDRKDRDWVNALNTLYVALTRARAELHIIGVKGARDRYPFDLLGEPASSAPEPPLVVREASPAEGPAVKRARFRPAFEPKPDPRDVLTTAHIRRGEAVHALLAEIEFVSGDWASEARNAVARVNPAEPDRPLFEAASEVVARYFDGAPVAALFESRPGRSIRNEFEVCDAAGRVLRMDRAIVDAEGITVLDYKTGPAPGAGGESEAAAADRAQIGVYTRLLRDVFPGRPVRGILVYIDHPGMSEEAV
jgi:ATP-dependent exoDNAse (exonuclease V) beta subunit